MSVARARVWNEHTEEHVEEFRGEILRIPPKSFIELPWPSAVQFRGQYTPILRDGLGQERVAGERITFRQFTGVHVGFAGVARGVDQKLRFGFKEKIQQPIKARVVHLFPAERNEVVAAAFQFFRKRLPDVAGGACEDDG